MNAPDDKASPESPSIPNPHPRDATKSVRAYDVRERVQRYDTDMDLLHPNRHKMAAVVLDVLPFDANDTLVALDLGIGTGFLTGHVLRAYPRSSVIGVDGSSEMIALAKVRLSSFADRVRLVSASFAAFDLESIPDLDLVLSSFALHHLDRPSKHCVLEGACNRLKPGGWFMNADMFATSHADIERIIRDIRAAGIVTRNAGTDPRFVNETDVRAFLDGLAASEGDQPLNMQDDLELLRQAGIENASVFWQEYREIVYGGYKPRGAAQATS